MRILFISAFYPPYVIGGWEQLVEDINRRLQERGHQTLVLTSDYGVQAGSVSPNGVKRLLTLESDLVNYRPLQYFTSHERLLRRNLQAVQETIQSFQPDIVFIHSMWNLSPAVAWQAEQACPGRVVYYMANPWPYAPSTHEQYWRDPARSPVRRVMKGLLAPFALRKIKAELRRFPLRFERVLCVSQAMKNDLEKNAGIPSERMQVVYNGVEVDRFTPAEKGADAPHRLSLLYAGSLVSHKGVHTAVKAVHLLKQQNRLGETTLTIVGSGHPDYEAHLKNLTVQYGLEQSVFFWPRVTREEMPALLQKFNVLVFPSIWEEPLARMMQEAMAAGLVVVGTLTGGSPEILQEGVTGLTFSPEDAAGLARQLDRLASDPDLFQRLAANGRQIVLEKFDICRMIDEIEHYLVQAAG